MLCCKYALKSSNFSLFTPHRSSFKSNKAIANKSQARKFVSAFSPMSDLTSQSPPSMEESLNIVEKGVKKSESGNSKAKEILEKRLAHKRKQTQILSTVSDAKLKFQMAAKSYIEGRNDRYLNNTNVKYCPKCWILVRGCICSKLVPVSVRHTYITWLHYKEIWRTTNTGTLLPHSCPDAKLLIYGKEEDDAEMERIMTEELDRTVILFPTQDSISLQQYFESKRTPEEGPIENWEEFAKTAPRLNIIAVDATWGQARSMTGGLPDNLPRVHLNNPPKYSVSRMRNQGEAGRITTVEALACLIQELHEDPPAYENLMHNLSIRCDAIGRLSGAKAKVEPSHSVLNRELREQANREKKAEKRAARELAKQRRQTETQSAGDSSGDCATPTASSS